MFRPHQQRAIEQLRDGFRKGHKRQMLTAPCAFGKSYMATRLMAESFKRSGKTSYFIADRTVLTDDAYKDALTTGLEVGVYQADHPAYNPFAELQICTIQTLSKLREGYPKHAGLIFIDEAHIWRQSYQDLMEECPNVPIIGMSATPLTKGLGKHFTNLVTGATAKELIDGEYLVDLVAYSPSRPDLDGVRVNHKSGDYSDKALYERLKNTKIVGDAVKSYLKYGQGRKFIAFCINIAHSQDVAQQFERSGISIAHIDGYMEREEKQKIIKDYRDGVYQGLTSVNMTSYGFDVPEASCAILLRPTKSLMFHIQVLGRVSRTAPGKEYGLILDHVGNCQDHPMPKDFEVYSLSKGEKKGGDARIKKVKQTVYCSSCGKELEGNPCPHCGHEFQKRSKIRHTEAELRLLDKNNKLKEAKARFASMAMQYGKDKGYKPGYWKMIFKERYKEWPPWDTKPIPVGKEFTNYLKYKNIRRAKRNENQKR